MTQRGFGRKKLPSSADDFLSGVNPKRDNGNEYNSLTAIRFLHHIRLVPLFACILGGILVLFALSSALAGYFLWQADRDQRDVTAEIEIRTGLANSSDFCVQPGSI